MNIFVLSRNPWAAARMMCDQHVVKMILESAQILNTTIMLDQHRPRTVTGEIYRQTHVNHPCSIWARSSVKHTRWLLMHGMALCLEYRRRYNKTHALHFFFVNMLRWTGFMQSEANQAPGPYYYTQSHDTIDLCRGLIRWGCVSLLSSDKEFSDALDSGIITHSDCVRTTERTTLTNDYWITVVMTNEIGSRVLDYLSENPNFYFYEIDYVQAMPDEYKHSNPVTAYRNYYRAEKSKFARYSRGVDPPKWLADSL